MKKIAVAAVLAAGFCGVMSAEDFGSYGDATIVSPGINGDSEAFQLTSDPAGTGYAGLYWIAQAATPLSDITVLSALYQMTVGTFNGGAPRFSILDTTNNLANEAYVYWGTPQSGGTFTDPNAGSFGTAGNYADLSSTDVRVQVNGFGGDSTGAAYETWAQFVAHDGATDVAYITLDLDGGFSPPGQQMLVNYFTVGLSTGDTFVDATPEPGTLLLLGGGLALTAFARRRFASR